MRAASTCPDLSDAFVVGKRRFPSVCLTWGEFQARCTEVSDLLFPEDLFWALACAGKNSEAVEAFESQIMSLVPAYMRPLRIPQDHLDDFLQEFRIKLLYAASPLIAKFSGRGPLRAWIRVAATRAALRYMASNGVGSHTHEGEEAIAKLADPRQQEALGALLQTHKGELKATVEEAIAQLSEQDRVILRMYVLDDVNIAGIGQLYGVHRATVARWIISIRSQLLSSVHAQLGSRIKVSAAEADSLFRQFSGDIRVSISRVLGR